MKFIKTALSVAISTALIPICSNAQESDNREALEEVVVTGSYIKRDKFDMASPVETIDAETILSSGQTTIGGLVRSLPYTQNVDTVANVLATGGGQQDSNGARFNLRGLGANSTLTLMDGRRAIDPEAIATILPELAMSTIDIVLDGGAATYGTDAVAGVVNFIPKQEYEGFKIRGFYTVDGEGDSPEPKLSLLWGKSWDKLDVVAAMDYSKRDTPLLRSDRPKFNKADANTSTYGNPGTYRTYNGDDNGNAVGSTLGAGTPDPGCGANNGTATDDANAGVYPTGVAAPFFTCYYDYGEYQDYKRPNENFVVYTSLTYDLNDDVALKAIINYSDRTSVLYSSPTTFNTGSNNLLRIDGPTGPNPHPNNPYAFDVSPDRWRPFTGPKTGMTQPSLLENNGSYAPEYNYETYQINLGSEFDIGSSGWYGEAWTVFGNRERVVSGAQIQRDRLQLALQGQGGASGTEWFNPFATSSNLSPTYGDCAAGTGTDLANGNTCSMNTQSVVDWIFIPGSSNIESKDYWSVEAFVTGDIFEMPAGPMSMAVGAQIRNTEEVDRPTYQASTVASTLGFQTPGGNPVSQAYNVDPADGVLDPNGTSGVNQVNSVFVEVVTPLLDNLEMNIALRYEDFSDFGLSTTVPKISFRWEPIEGLAFRTSWGEGFLAPTIGQATVLPDPGCGEAFSGTDNFGFSYIGADICSNGSSTLEPEESEIFNIGLSWQAMEDLEVSLDYQTIDYVNRISLLGSSEIIGNDYQAFLDAGLDETSATDRNSWYTSGQDTRIVRGNLPGDEGITRIDRTYDNISDMAVELIDFRTRYSLDLDSWGYLSASLTSTVYLSYELLQADGSTYEAVGKRNSGFNIAPPISKYKNSLRLGWMLDSHNLAISVNNHGGVDMDYGSLDGPFTFGPAADRADPATAPTYIDAYTTIDMRYGYVFDDVAGGSLDLGFGANNATNNVAQALPVLGGLETRLQDPIGRTFYIEGTYSFE